MFKIKYKLEINQESVCNMTPEGENAQIKALLIPYPCLLEINKKWDPRRNKCSLRAPGRKHAEQHPQLVLTSSYALAAPDLILDSHSCH